LDDATHVVLDNSSTSFALPSRKKTGDEHMGERHVKRGDFLSGIGTLPCSVALVASRARSATAAGLPDRSARIAQQGSAAYEAWRENLVWQSIKPARYPYEIVGATSSTDIVETIARARSLGRTISIVSGGHSYIGVGLQDGTIVLDLSALRAAHVAADGKTAMVEPGLRVGAFEAMLRGANLAFPFGHDPHVGLGGYLLGGGLGWNPDSWGHIACFNIEAIDVVLASGEAVRADRSTHPDLLWAARGAGPNFPGVVTAFHVNVFPRPSVIRESTYVYPLARTREVAAWLDRLSARQTANTELSLNLSRDGGTPICSVSAISFAESEAEAQRLHQAAQASAPPADPIRTSELQPRTFADLLAEDGAPAPARHAVETMWTDAPGAAAIVSARHFEAAPSDDTIVYFGYRTPAERRADGAYSVIGKSYMFADASWTDPAADARSERWLRELSRALTPFNKGTYVNETDFLRNPGHLRRSYDPAALVRLQSIIEAYDPQHRFACPLRAASI